MSPAGVNYAPIVATYGSVIPFQFGGDIATLPFYVEPLEGELNSLLLEPYNSILEVSIGTTQDTGIEGGFAELNFPTPFAGQLTELIQKNGNLSPVRF